MKKLVLTLLGAFFIFTSCEETEAPIYNSNTTNASDILAYFSRTSADLGILIDETGSVTVPIGASTLSSQDRVVSISIVEELTTADPVTYTLPSTVTIPANSYFGDLVIDGVDIGVETTPETITIKLDSFDNGVVSSAQLEVSIFQVCPIPETYMVGDYLLTDSNGNFGVDVPVTLTIDPDDSTARIFTAEFLPGTGVARDVDVVVNLKCFNFVIDPIDINVQCTGPAYIVVEAGNNNSMYDLSNDTMLTVNYLEDPNASCSAAPSVQNFTLTKL
ncbi:hypothetical protein EZY14_006640 [Kordia sp. TARA_039_SRF]|nr:hypothetical protein EZY14_006640 [Kordia sp. TARA_039_SRF]